MQISIIFFSVATFVLGCALVLQSSINSSLKAVLGGTFWHAFVSNWGALVIGFAVTLGLSAPPLTECVKNSCGAVRKNPSLVLMFCGGFLVLVYLVAIVLATMQLGLGLCFISVVTGQVTTALLIETFGFLWAKKRPLRLPTILGATFIIVGNLVFQFEELNQITFDQGLLIIAGATGGGCIVSAAAMTRKMTQYFSTNGEIGGYFRCFTWNMGSGLLLLTILALADYPNPNFKSLQPSDWWKFLGGVMGIYGMAINAIAPTYLGFAATSSWIVMGQLCMSMILDHYGALGVKEIPLTLYRVLGMLLTISGVLLVSVGAVTQERKEAHDYQKSKSSYSIGSQSEPVSSVYLSKKLIEIAVRAVSV